MNDLVQVDRRTEGMKPPLFVRPLSPDEYSTLRAGLRSPSAFTLRRSQILLASAQGLKPAQTARNALRAFAAEGTACLHEKSHRPRSARPALDAARRERLRAVLHHSPRQFGKPTGAWTLATAAGVCHEQGITDRLVSHEAI